LEGHLSLAIAPASSYLVLKIWAKRENKTNTHCFLEAICREGMENSREEDVKCWPRISTAIH
jgi:hypothetical protein